MKIALIGNPNCGKTTLFNTLTRSNARVGNWPGVTVEQRIGKYKRKNQEIIEVVDLPGIYSLSPYTSEEIISRDYLIENEIDCVVNIVDSTNLERNLYLTTQLLEMDINIVLCLNFIDVFNKTGASINIKKLEEELGVPVCTISALKSKGINNLIDKVRQAANNKRKGMTIFNHTDLGKLIESVASRCKQENITSPFFHATKFLENDEIERKDHPFLEKDCREMISTFIRKEQNENIEEYIASSRYNYIDKICSKLLVKPHRSAYSKSDKVDRILTNKWFGIPIFIAIMFLIFQITFSEDFLFFGKMTNTSGIPSLGTYLQGLVEKLFELITGGIESGLTNISAPSWSISFINEGIFGAIGAVLSFLPQVLLLFLFIQILENSGYMSRVAFIFDRILRNFGLSGRSLVPLISCFGCAVPGIMGTRTVESKKEKALAISLTPFFSCSAKLPIYLAIAGVVTNNVVDPSIIAFLMYFLGIVVAIIVSFILHKTKYRNNESVFIMELPSYHVPSFKNTSLAVLDELKKFLIRAGTLIAGSSIVLWFLQNFNWTWGYTEGNINVSIISDIGKFIQPIFVPLGFAESSEGWKFVVAALTGLVAKEQVVASLELLSGGDINLLLGTLSSSSAMAFMAFNLLTLPCIAAISAAKAELKDRKTFVFVLITWALISYVCSMFVSSFGSLILLASGKQMSVMNIVSLIVSVLLIVGGILLAILIKNKPSKNSDSDDYSNGSSISCFSCSSKTKNRRCCH